MPHRLSSRFAKAASAALCAMLMAGSWVALGESAAPKAKKSRAQPENRIWTALVLASNEAEPKEAPPELRCVADSVERFFGYNQVQLIGAAVKNMDERDERWLVPSQNFWLSVKSRRATPDEYVLDLALFHDRRQLVETEAKLRRESPLFIRGPVHARGQILIVLRVVK